MRRFYLQRNLDVSGVSGLGHVAEGVLFSDGRVAMRWIVEPSTIVHYKHLEHVTAIHGHLGKTKLVFIDAEASTLEAALEQKE